MGDIVGWTVEDREALALVTLGAFDIPDRGELVRRITASYVPRRQLAGAVKENVKLRDLCERAVDALRYEANPVCDEWDDWLATHPAGQL